MHADSVCRVSSGRWYRAAPDSLSRNRSRSFQTGASTVTMSLPTQDASCVSLQKEPLCFREGFRVQLE